MLILLKVRVLWFCLAPIFETCFETLGPFIRGKIRRELYHLYEHVLSNKTRLSQAASYFRRNVPFIRKVRVLFKTRLM